MAEAKKAVFLDRDGTISSDVFGYISDPTAYRLYPETGPALRLMQSLGYLLFIVTNQSGIARGYFGHQELRKVHDRMEALLAEEGVYLDAIYYSPYWKDGVVVPYNVEHEDRKPGTGMYKRAMADFGFSRKDSWMIGDRATDIAFGQNAGLRTIMLLSGNGRDELEGGIVRSVHAPDFVAQNIFTAARLIELCDKSK